MAVYSFVRQNSQSYTFLYKFFPITHPLHKIFPKILSKILSWCFAREEISYKVLYRMQNLERHLEKSLKYPLLGFWYRIWQDLDSIWNIAKEALVVAKREYHLRPQASKYMTRVGLKWIGRCCLSIVALGYAYPLSHLSVHHLLGDSRRKLSMKRNSFPPNHWPLF